MTSDKKLTTLDYEGKLEFKNYRENHHHEISNSAFVRVTLVS